MAGLVLCMILIWMGGYYLLFRSLPSKPSNDVHWNAQSQSQQQQIGGENLRHKLPTMRTKGHKRQESPYNIVHGMTTRFMLGQKGQPILARARYLLFETFCQPTVRYQTALEASKGYEFSWFVLADPGLDKEIIDDLRGLLSQKSSSFPEGNAYLILSDNPSWAADGVGVPGVTSYGAGFEEIAKGVRDAEVACQGWDGL